MLEYRRQLTVLCYDGNRRFRTKTPLFRDIFHIVLVMTGKIEFRRTGVRRRLCSPYHCNRHPSSSEARVLE